MVERPGESPRCRRCGGALSTRSRFCHRCGVSLTGASRALAWLPAILAGVCFVVLGQLGRSALGLLGEARGSAGSGFPDHILQAILWFGGAGQILMAAVGARIASSASQVGSLIGRLGLGLAVGFASVAGHLLLRPELSLSLLAAWNLTLLSAAVAATFGASALDWCGRRPPFSWISEYFRPLERPLRFLLASLTAAVLASAIPWLIAGVFFGFLVVEGVQALLSGALLGRERVTS